MKNLIFKGIGSLLVILSLIVFSAKLYAYEGSDVSGGGIISGSTLFSGTAPARGKVEITKDKEVCAAEEHMSDLLIVNGNKIENVIVSITDIEKGKKVVIPSSNPSLDQNGCVFKPHVIAVAAGTSIDIINSDSVTHNVHTYPEENSAMNKAQPPSLKVISIATEFGEEDPMKVACDYHGWMSSWVGIFEHPYFAVTGADGAFSLDSVPPGAYEVKAWQEELGELVKTVQVKAGETTSLDFEFTLN